MSDYQIPIERLEALTGRPVARMWEAGVVSWPGAVLIVPLSMIGGDLTRLTVNATGHDVATVWDAMDKPRPIPLDEARAGLWPGPGSQFDVVAALVRDTGHPGGWWVIASNSLAQRVFTHDGGVRLGLAASMVDRGVAA